MKITGTTENLWKSRKSLGTYENYKSHWEPMKIVNITGNLWEFIKITEKLWEPLRTYENHENHWEPTRIYKKITENLWEPLRTYENCQYHWEPTCMRIYKNHWESMRTTENLTGNLREFIKITEKLWEPLRTYKIAKITGNLWEFMKITENLWEPMKITRNLWQLTKITENHWEPTCMRTYENYPLTPSFSLKKTLFFSSSISCDLSMIPWNMSSFRPWSSSPTTSVSSLSSV